MTLDKAAEKIDKLGSKLDNGLVYQLLAMGFFFQYAMSYETVLDLENSGLELLGVEIPHQVLIISFPVVLFYLFSKYAINLLGFIELSECIHHPDLKNSDSLKDITLKPISLFLPVYFFTSESSTIYRIENYLSITLLTIIPATNFAFLISSISIFSPPKYDTFFYILLFLLFAIFFNQFRKKKSIRANSVMVIFSISSFVMWLLISSALN